MINKNVLKDLALDFIYGKGLEDDFADWVNYTKIRSRKKEKADKSYIG